MPILSIRHLTRYAYRKPVAFGEHRMMLRPLEAFDQRVLEWDLSIGPVPAQLRHVHDVFGNCVGVASFGEPARELSFLSEVKLDHRPAAAFAGGRDEACDLTDLYDQDDLPDLARFIARHHADPDGQVERWARGFVSGGGKVDLPDLLTEMTEAIYGDFRYGARHERGVQPPAETLRRRGGTCRDFAVLMIEAVRSLGMAAMFASGYIHTPPRHRAPDRRGGGHTHAWARVYLPSSGWVDFDPTNGLVGGRDLIRVAVARDPRQALPLHGTWAGEASDYAGMEVEVEVIAHDHGTPAPAPGFQPSARQPSKKESVGMAS